MSRQVLLSFYGVAPFLGRSLEPGISGWRATCFRHALRTWISKLAPIALCWQALSLEWSFLDAGVLRRRDLFGGGADIWMAAEGPQDPKVVRNDDRQYWGVVPGI